MTATPSVAIVILNWNNALDTLECLDSVFQIDYPAYDPIVVDNGSSDDSVNRIRSKYPGVELLETGKNLGYGGGNNVGIRHAIKDGASYVFVLNNDTLVAPTILKELVQVAESNPKIGIVGPIVLLHEPQDVLYSAGSFIDWKKGATWHRGLYQPAGQYTELQKPEPVDFIAGCGMLVRRDLIEAAGYLDPRYYLNFEDVEWCVRAHRHGFEVYFAPGAVIWHKDSATMGRGSPVHTYYLTRNGLRFFWQNAPRHLRWLPVTRLLLTTMRAVGAWSVKSAYRSEDYRRRRKANLFAIRDFFLGRFDQMGLDVAAVCSRVR
jgi:GT2 family glycosyltransferase